MRFWIFLCWALFLTDLYGQRIDLEGDIIIYRDSLDHFTEEAKVSLDTPFLISVDFLLGVRKEALRRKPEEATFHFINGLNLAEKYGDDYYTNKLKSALANHFLNANLAHESLRYFEELKMYFEKIEDSEQLAHVHTSLANAKYQLKELDSAYDHLQKAESYTKDTFLLSIIHFSRGRMSFLEGGYNAAIPFFLKAEPLAEKANRIILSPTALMLGQSYWETGNPREALPFLKKAVRYAAAINDIGVQKIAHCYLVDVLFALNNPEEAQAHFTPCTQLQDSVFRVEKGKEMRELLLKYDKEKIEKELLINQQQNALNKQKIRLRNLSLLFLVFLLILVLGFALFVRKTLRAKLQVSKALQQNQKALHETSLKQVRTEQQYQQTLSLIQGQEEERRRMGRDLHDGVGGHLSALRFKLDEIQDATSFNLKTIWKSSTQILDSAIRELRSIAKNAVPDPLLHQGLEFAIRNYVDSVFQLKAISYSVFVSGQILLPETERLFAFRILQELIQNATKHAQCKKIEIILLERETDYQFTVSDDGKGMDAAALDSLKGSGLAGIQYRIDMLNGYWEIDSQEDYGTTIFVNIPK